MDTSPTGTARPAPPARPGPDPRWAPPPRRSRLPSTAELLGWGGGLTTLVGVIAVTWDLWSTISDGALVALLLLATVVAGVAAAVVGDLDRPGDADRLAATLSAGLWWVTGLSAVTSCYVATAAATGGRANLALLAASMAATAMTAAAAHRTGADGTWAASLVSAGVAAFAAASLADGDPAVRAAAVALVGLAAAAALVVIGHGRTRTSWATASVVLLGSTQAMVASGPDALLVGGVAAGLIAVAVGASVRRTTGEALLVAALAALVSGELAYEVAPDAFSLPTTVLLAGVAMTAACAWLVRRAGRGGGSAPR